LENFGKKRGMLGMKKGTRIVDSATKQKFYESCDSGGIYGKMEEDL